MGTACFYGDTRMATTAPPLLSPPTGALHDAALPLTWTVMWLASAVSAAVMNAKLVVVKLKNVVLGPFNLTPMFVTPARTFTRGIVPPALQAACDTDGSKLHAVRAASKTNNFFIWLSSDLPPSRVVVGAAFWRPPRIMYVGRGGGPYRIG